MSKIWFANNKFTLCKRFTINEPSIMLFFVFFSFPLFQISNDYCQKSYYGFQGFLESSATSQVFLIYTFLTKKRRHFFNFFEICTEMRFVSLFFLNERNIATILLMIHLKCTVLHYADLNSSYVNKPFLNYETLNMLFRFFQFLVYVYFSKAFVKEIMK